MYQLYGLPHIAASLITLPHLCRSTPRTRSFRCSPPHLAISLWRMNPAKVVIFPRRRSLRAPSTQPPHPLPRRAKHSNTVPPFPPRLPSSTPTLLRQGASSPLSLHSRYPILAATIRTIILPSFFLHHALITMPRPLPSLTIERPLTI